MTGRTEGIETSLARYQALTAEAMRGLLAAAPPAAFLSDLVRDYPERGGKGIRPALLLATCQAFGGSLSEGLGAAAAIEMLHNAFLVHDDIADSSITRRGRPTLHAKHGVGLALNAGDALATHALRVLRDDDRLGGLVAGQLVDEFLAVVTQTTEGQALELGWQRERATDLRISDYLLLAGKKTCWYTTVAPLRMGAVIGSRGTAELRAISRFGFYLGLAFQIRDDLMNIEATADSTGKDGRTDLRDRKPTLMLLHLLETAAGADRAALVGWLVRSDDHSAPDGERLVLELMERYHALDLARQYGVALTSAASAAYEDAFGALPDSEHLEFLRGMIPYMVVRGS